MTDDELHDRYHCTTDPVERSHRYVLWLLVGGMTADAVAAMIGYSAYRIGHIAGRYNRETVTAPTACGISAMPLMHVGRSCRRHSRRSWERLWLARIPRATAGADGPWLPGSAFSRIESYLCCLIADADIVW